MPAPRNAEQTKQLILDAAMTEFVAYGVAGARVDRIATLASCNKNLIYIYFGNKESLLTAVLQENLPRIYDELDFDATDLGAFAGRVFDLAHSHPGLMRLLAWSSLEMPSDAVPARGKSRHAKLSKIRKAQASGQLSHKYPPDFLLTAVLALATAWSGVAPFGPSPRSVTAKQTATTRRLLVDMVTAAIGQNF